MGTATDVFRKWPTNAEMHSASKKTHKQIEITRFSDVVT